MRLTDFPTIGYSNGLSVPPSDSDTSSNGPFAALPSPGIWSDSDSKRPVLQPPDSRLVYFQLYLQRSTKYGPEDRSKRQIARFSDLGHPALGAAVEDFFHSNDAGETGNNGVVSARR